MNTKTPRDFLNFPYDSILHNSESETVARNIMVILSRTGNVFRELSWEEYLRERTKDSGGNTRNQQGTSEKTFFKAVVVHCSTLGDAMRFSDEWNK